MVVLPSRDGDEQLIDLRDGVDGPTGLRIEVVGRPSVRLDGVPVRFATRHAELTVYLLALAGPRGIEAGTLTHWLWPSAPSSRRGPRFRTLLWQVRSALDTEAWRLRRDGSSVVLDVAGEELDVTASAFAVADPGPGRGVVQLRARVRAARPLLEGWGAAVMLAELGIGPGEVGSGHATVQLA